MTGFTPKASAEGFIVVYPDGTSRRAPLLTWNAGHCCGYAMEQRVDDVAFISALIEDLAARFPIDRKRIYVTGMSNGAMMAHRLGSELSYSACKRACAVVGLPLAAIPIGEGDELVRDTDAGREREGVDGIRCATARNPFGRS